MTKTWIVSFGNGWKLSKQQSIEADTIFIDDNGHLFLQNEDANLDCTVVAVFPPTVWCGVELEPDVVAGVAPCTCGPDCKCDGSCGGNCTCK